MLLENAFEVGINELTHPNPKIRSRMEEHSISDCKYGCKYYHDKVSGAVVLRHHATYGCKRTKADIRQETDPFANSNAWMVTLKDRIPQETWDGLMVKVGFKVMSEGIRETGEGIKEIVKPAGVLSEALRTMKNMLGPLPRKGPVVNQKQYTTRDS